MVGQARLVIDILFVSGDRDSTVYCIKSKPGSSVRVDQLGGSFAGWIGVFDEPGAGPSAHMSVEH